MAKKKDKTEKPLNEMKFKDLNRKALIEHALSLGDISDEALAYLDELAETIPVTDEMREEKRKELQSKKKFEEDENGNKIETDKPLYNEKQIENIVNNMQPKQIYNIFEIKQRYCEKYYPQILKKKDKPKSFKDMIAEAKASRSNNNNNTANSSLIKNADELKKLKELLDTDAITQEEFEEAKKKLLNLK